MKYIDADKLKAEIESIKSTLCICDNDYQMAIDGWQMEAYNKVITIFDTLSEEPDKSLEEAAYKYSFDSRPSIYGQVDVIDAFKAGAEWQASQMPMPEDTVLFQKGVAEGRKLEREDMTKCMSNILAPDDPATNEEIKKMLQEYRTMIEKEVQRRVFNEVEHCWEEAHHEGYIEGWNECDTAYKSK